MMKGNFWEIWFSQRIVRAKTEMGDAVRRPYWLEGSEWETKTKVREG